MPADSAVRRDARGERSIPARPFVLEGPEYLAVYRGETGKEIDKVDWIERGKPRGLGRPLGQSIAAGT